MTMTHENSTIEGLETIETFMVLRRNECVSAWKYCFPQGEYEWRAPYLMKFISI